LTVQVCYLRVRRDSGRISNRAQIIHGNFANMYRHFVRKNILARNFQTDCNREPFALDCGHDPQYWTTQIRREAS
jgi:hypothetical protein